MSAPRAVFGVPTYEHAAYLPEALESLLAQTRRDFAIVVCDDRSSDETVDVARRYAVRYPRLTVEVNERRLGLAANWWQVFRRARALHPGAEYFAWASDHDVWHPRFLQELVAALDQNPSAILAYPRNVRVDAGNEVIRQPWSDRDTRGLQQVPERAVAAYRSMVPGDMVYGLMRARALERARFRAVLVPDRLLLSEMALQGEFVQVPQVLWRRRFKHPVTPERQRRALYPEGAPLWSRLPWWMPHAAAMLSQAATEPPYEGLNRARRIRIAARLSVEAARMHGSGRVNFLVNRLAEQLDQPSNPVAAVVLPRAARARRLLARRVR